MSTTFRKPTSQLYGHKKTVTPAPKAQVHEEPEVKDLPAPSYKFADKQQGVVDTEAEDRDKEDEEIREGQGKNSADVEQPITSFKKKEKAVIKNDKFDRSYTEPTTGSNVFEAFWSRETDYDLEEVTHTQKNSWTPNALAMFEILDAASIFVTESRIIAKHHPNYLDYAVSVYYAIMFYIQILRAQQAAGHLTGSNLKFLRRFDRMFRPEELPITCILEPYFSSITSCLLPDSKYTWIMPDIAPGLFSAQILNLFAQNKPISDGGVYIQPMVPMMLSILRTAITQARQNALNHTLNNLGGGDAGDNTPLYFNDRDEYIPMRISDNNGQNLFGVAYQNGQARNDGRNSMFYFCGVTYPFHADYDRLANAAPRWRRSSFATLAEANLNNGTRANNRLDFFLHMEEDDDLEWFRELILQAGIHARFFGDVKSFSDIPVVGGIETLISCQFKKANIGGNGVHTFPDYYLGAGTTTLANGTDPWYSDRFRNMVGSFYTTRNGYKRQEVLQAMTFAANATMPIGAGPARVGEEHTTYRKGPYWTNMEWTATRFADAGQLGKPMFAGWRELIQTTFAKIKPAGY
uniref:Capsid protein n=1 Tax=Rosellinia necatrix partitivirus 5 TaxID=1148494 RepID=A0A6F8UMR9_9VIRU|nr:capsid protein [Rosellinia necatrix partitivirus 5]